MDKRDVISEHRWIWGIRKRNIYIYNPHCQNVGSISNRNRFNNHYIEYPKYKDLNFHPLKNSWLRPCSSNHSNATCEKYSWIFLQSFSNRIFTKFSSDTVKLFFISSTSTIHSSSKMSVLHIWNESNTWIEWRFLHT